MKKNPPARIVGIGASAGGLQAIYSLFDHLITVPEELSFVIIQHLSPDYKSLMPELLSRHTHLEIKSIENALPISSGVVYVAQPNKTVKIINGTFVTEDRDTKNLLHYPINSFFASLAKEQEDKAIAVILSGSGSDGTHGIEAIKEKGGTVLVQEESTAAFTGMPNSAIITGLVDQIAPPEEIPEILRDIINGTRIGKSLSKIRLEEANEEAIAMMLLNEVKKATSLDFNHYKSNTIVRRIERRMQKLGIKSISEYNAYVGENPIEAGILANEFLINVTGFFRDEKPFEYLSEVIIPKIFKDNKESDQIRVWSIGCATGQEPYSIAMLMADYVQKQKLQKQIKIFATDAHNESLNYASKGIYTSEEIENVPKELKEKYFTSLDEVTFQIKPAIRDLIVFARHNVIKDPPFNNLHFVACRNLLIYLKPELQQKILSFIHFSLIEKGILFLGFSESPYLEDNKYRVLNSVNRVYEKSNSMGSTSDIVSLYVPNDSLDYGKKVISKKGFQNGSYTTTVLAKEPIKMIDKIKDHVLETVTSPTVILNETNEIVHVFGEVEQILHFPKKQFHLNILKMVPEELYVPVSTIITNVRKENKAVTFNKVTAKVKNTIHDFTINAFPIHTDAGDPHLIAVSFEVGVEKKGVDYTSLNIDDQANLRVSQLEAELKETKDYIQNIVEQLETSNEELQATNEELVASNEELQSTNEELQSVNEELYSVNTEFQSKVAEMVEANDDLNNLLHSTEIGTIFLDKELKIRRYTQSITEQINIGEGDLGRPISDLNNKLVNIDLEQESNMVLKKLESLEKEVTNKSNHHYLMRMAPYRNSEDKIFGVVITFVNIDRLKKTESSLKFNSKNLTRINKELEQVAYVATHDLRAPVINLQSLLDIHIKRRAIEKGDEIVSRLKENINRILTTLDGLIGVISYQKSMTKKPETVQVKELIESIVSGMETTLFEQKATVNLDLKVGKLEGITGYFRSIFLNLITNSLKYRHTDRNPVISIRSYKDDQERTVFEVTDNGIGIDQKYSETIFQAFKRVSNNVEGKGIGLYLVKSQVETMGGTISVKSILGTSTTFTIVM